jgi:hypothetical protein|tara:strand:- start:28 stop:228 length:201 start_codon:yes stop_codon:yes gene_type:complete
VNDSKVISLAQAREKEAELSMYRAKLETLYVRQSFIEAEITLTNKIIELIEQEKLIEIVPSESDTE